MEFVAVCALLLLIHVGYCQEISVPPPLLNVSKQYVDVPPHTSLTIECRGEREVAWYLNLSMPWKEDKIPLQTFNFTGSIKRAFIHLPPFYYCTGLYVCFYKDRGNVAVELQKNASVYVFMNDPEHLFVPQTEFNTTSYLHQNSSSHLYIPCLSTNSRVEVTLWEFTNVSDEVNSVPISEVIKYYPMKGFLVLEPLSRDFICRGNWNGLQESTCIFRINTNATKPFIEGSAVDWNIGDTTSMTCFVAVQNYDPSQRLLTWTYPQSKDNSIPAKEENPLLRKKRQSYDLLFRTLSITKVERSHEGLYTCSLMNTENNTAVEISRDEIYKSVNDGNKIEPINFKTRLNTSPILGKAGDSVEFSVNITNYSLENIEFHWEKNGLLIQETDKYKLNSNSSSITLSISKLSISDAARYTLFARVNQSIISNISFLLAVEGDLSVQIVQPLSDDRLYEYGEQYKLNCVVESYPESNVSWSWTNCSDCKTCNGLVDPSLTTDSSEEQLDSSMFRTTSVLTIEADGSGILCCTATNNWGINQTFIHFIVTDIPNGKAELLTEGRDPSKDSVVKVQCRVTSTIYENITWSFIQVPGNYQMVAINPDTPGFEISKDPSSKYSETSVLTFDANNDRNGLYVCTYKDKRKGKQKDKFIAVYTIGDDSPPSGIPPVSQDGENMFSPTVVTIISVVVVAVLLIIVTVIAVAIEIRRKKLRYNPYTLEPGQVNLINPDLPLEDQVELLPYDPKWEFPRDRLKIVKVIGHGAFGRVVKAEAIGLEPNVPRTIVAAKMLKDKNDEIQYKSLMAELKIMIHLGRHVNIVNLKGAVTKNLYKGDLMVLVEFCCHGNLRSFLLRHREKFINQIDPATGKINSDIGIEEIVESVERKRHDGDYTKPIALGISNPSYDHNSNSAGPLINSPDGNYAETTGGSDATLVGRETSTGTVGSESGYSSTGEAVNFPFNSKECIRYSGFTTSSDLLCYCFQCAQGMTYLASRKLLHRDLAARNILLAEGNVIKISDFGLARDVYKYSKYVKKANAPLPVKWMAIESIRDRVFTIKSDVWSFGVLMWEVFTLGGNPYPGSEMNEEFFRRLQEGYRMGKPEYCPADIYQMMLDCWQKNPKDRPDFSSLSEQLGCMLEASVKEHYLDLNSPYEKLNTDLRNMEDYLNMNTPNYMKMSTDAQETNVDSGPDYMNSTQNQLEHTYYNIPPVSREPNVNECQSGVESEVALNVLPVQMDYTETEVNTEGIKCKEDLLAHSDSSASAESENKQNKTDLTKSKNPDYLVLH